MLRDAGSRSVLHPSSPVRIGKPPLKPEVRTADPLPLPFRPGRCGKGVGRPPGTQGGCALNCCAQCEPPVAASRSAAATLLRFAAFDKVESGRSSAVLSIEVRGGQEKPRRSRTESCRSLHILYQQSISGQRLIRKAIIQRESARRSFQFRCYKCANFHPWVFKEHLSKPRRKLNFYPLNTFNKWL